MDELLQTILGKLGMQVPKAPKQLDPTTQALLDQRAKAEQAAMPAGPTSLVRHGIDSASQFVRGLGYNPTDPVPADADASYKVGGMAAAAAPLFAPKSIPGMYSRVERLVESLPEVISTAKLQSILKSGRVAQEELNWRKVPDFLSQAGPTVSKQALADHLNANPLDVKVIRKGNPIGTQTLYGRPRPGAPGIPFWNSPPTAEQVEGGHYLAQNHPDKYYWKDDVEPTVWDNYQIPGYKPGSYREDLIQLANRTTPGLNDLAQRKYGQYFGDLSVAQQHDIELLHTSEDSKHFVGHHWDEPNVLVHVRHNERNLPPHETPSQMFDLQNAEHIKNDEWRLPLHEAGMGSYTGFGTTPEDAAAEAYAMRGRTGVEPKLAGPEGRMLENVQSDWHQRGAKHGYAGDPNNVDTLQFDRAHNLTAEASDHLHRTVLYTHEQLGIPLPSDIEDTPTEDLARNLANQLQHQINHPHDVNGAELSQEKYQQLHDLHSQLQGARVAFDNANDLMLHNVDHGVPDAPLKDAWSELGLKQQLLDIAFNHPNTKWVGIPPAHVLNARGEMISPAFQDQQLPRTLEKLMRPLGGKVEAIDTGVKSHTADPITDYTIGLHGGFTRRNPNLPRGQQIEDIFHFLQEPNNTNVIRLKDQIANQGPNIIAKGSYLTPEILAQIRKNGFSLLSALLANRMMASHQQPSNGQ